MNNHSTFEQQLSERGKIIYTNVGDSMMPLIKQGRDVLIIERPVAPLRRGDIPLYKRDSGQYVLHRIISARRGKYRICGDNRISVERGIEDRHIIGILTGLIRDGKELSVKEAEGGLYRFYICRLFFVRVIVFKLRALGRRVRELFAKDRT